MSGLPASLAGARVAILTVDDDPGGSRAVARDLRRRYGETYRIVRVPAYAAELNQVWTNLIDNAVGAMPDGGRLTVRAVRENDSILVEVGDTGAGVPAEIHTRIFEPFFTTKAVGEGTGLGLDISWRIVVTKHHGDLSVVSEPGDTQFQVRLPLVAEPESAPEPESADIDPETLDLGAIPK
jgi:Signal transduction histidine kinase